MKIREEFLSYNKPCFGQEELDGVVESLKSGWWSKGPKVLEFEKRFAEYVGVKHAIALNSCTAGLFLGLQVLGVGPGDEVITTPMTFCASSNTIVHCGATPVFADVDPETGLINPKEIEKKITPRTKGIVPVHYAGRACDMDAINAIAKKHGLFVLEDAAHAVYTTYENGNMVGNCDNIAAFSFYATKNLATGEGGMITTNDDALYEKLQVLSLHGMSKGAWNRFSAAGSWKYDVVEAGFKYNMTDMAAALGLAQLDRLQEMQNKREEFAAVYNQAFADVKGISVLPDGPWGRNAWHLYMIKIERNGLAISRDKFIRLLNEEYKIGTGVHYIPVPLHPFYRINYGTRQGDYPNAERLYSQIISIPLNPSLTREDVDYVCEAVREIAQRFSK